MMIKKYRVKHWVSHFGTLLRGRGWVHWCYVRYLNDRSWISSPFLSSNRYRDAILSLACACLHYCCPSSLTILVSSTMTTCVKCIDHSSYGKSRWPSHIACNPPCLYTGGTTTTLGLESRETLTSPLTNIWVFMILLSSWWCVFDLNVGALPSITLPLLHSFAKCYSGSPVTLTIVPSLREHLLRESIRVLLASTASSPSSSVPQYSINCAYCSMANLFCDLAATCLGCFGLPCVLGSTASRDLISSLWLRADLSALLFQVLLVF